jgi:type IV secretory pathway TrbL component
MEAWNMMLLKFVAGIALGVVIGGVLQTIAHGGGVIVGRDNVQNAIGKEENNVRGRFNGLKVTDSDPKFYD